ncbi:TrmH family RNA methyltransferase [Paenibacillus sp. JGP012]|uniref:TrmH family RNA methyltransferase n=1 Tax=Paenibacillus sp. JGP012 TaxID=2735914 RepID=UPI0016152107|nr:TrmH family RNA methyltransferase [Paenibacillus sp. JGP012]MBB6022756.1 TrmH family RNA methyltransferase [Paenibacillus sp. JGP012]
MSLLLKTYHRDLSHSYTLGVFPTIELIKHKPQMVKKVILHSKGSGNAGVEKLNDICGRLGIPIVINDKLTLKLSKKEDCFAVGVFQKYTSQCLKGQNHVILDHPSDMGNLGTIIRTVLGFGITNLGIIKPSVDIFNPKVIRASMGAIFRMNIEYYDDFDQYRSSHENSVYLFALNKSATKLTNINCYQNSPYTLVFGNEGSGLGEEYENKGEYVIIPHTDSIDSLNLSVAVGISAQYFTKDLFSAG